MGIGGNLIEVSLDKVLNKSQLGAVYYNDGPSVIVAGACSGKRRVLTYKIAYLLQQGYSPAAILALTFTNKAAREMKERIAQIVGVQLTRRLWMGTFHSIFSRILRAEAEAIGFTPQFTIYDSADSKSLVKSIIKEMQLDDKIYKPNGIQSQISSAKNRLITPDIYQGKSELILHDTHARRPLFIDIYRAYCHRCRAANAMDFDDLLLYTTLLFEHRPDILAKYQDIFQYILVDEYQDTNVVQHRIISQLAARHQRICAVGDDAQSIYSFRGANIENMLTFQRNFKECKLFKLEQNYRSTKTIVNAANSLIAKNKKQIKKEVFSELEQGEKICVSTYYSDYDEGYGIANDIMARVKAGEMSYEEIAILYRTNAQSRILEEALRKNAIPYKIYGGLSFYQRKAIKDVLAYLRLIVNPNDIEALKRVINYPARGIGNTTLDKVLYTIYERQLPVMEVLHAPIANGMNINKGTEAKLIKFATMLSNFARYNNEKDAYGVVEQVIFGSGIMTDVSVDTSPENLSRKENITEFLSAVHEFCDMRANEGETNISLIDFLSEVSLLTDQDNDKAEDKHVVTLMTVHASKGLEFKGVYIAGVEENLFPSSMSETERDIEEERRLFYVALTRAKMLCSVSYAKLRFKNG